MTTSQRVKIGSWSYGLVCHAAFAIAVIAMFFELRSGMVYGVLELQGGYGVLLNILLLLQFPLLHSYLLSRRGGPLLSRVIPGHYGKDLQTTSFTLISSLQLTIAMLCWSPSHGLWWQPTGYWLAIWNAAYLMSWLLLAKTMQEAGLGVQLGYLGWRAVATGRKPQYGSFGRDGLHSFIRQPIYLAFLLILLTGPVWNLDHALIVALWGSYCVIGPLLKERRYLKRYGEQYQQYRETTPYMLPNVGRSAQRG